MARKVSDRRLRVRAFLADVVQWGNETGGFAWILLWPFMVRAAYRDGESSPSLGRRVLISVVAASLLGFAVGALVLAHSSDASWHLKLPFWALAIYFLASGLVPAARPAFPTRR
jgi:hypothetical protein